MDVSYLKADGGYPSGSPLIFLLLLFSYQYHMLVVVFILVSYIGCCFHISIICWLLFSYQYHMLVKYLSCLIFMFPSSGGDILFSSFPFICHKLETFHFCLYQYHKNNIMENKTDILEFNQVLLTIRMG